MSLDAKKIKRFSLFIVFLLVVSLVLFILIINKLPQKENFLEVVFLDVGQGDSVLIKLPNKQKILIDAGPDKRVIYSLGRELSFFDRDIDLLILTHSHDDHLAGFLNVLNKFKVDLIFETGALDQTSLYEHWQEKIKELAIKEKIIEKQERIMLSEDVYLEIIYPIESIASKEIKNLNNASIVMRLVYGENSFLFTGDMEGPIEKKLLDEKIDVEADILKVAHHGSDTSSGEDFLKAVDPMYAVIQLGKDNKYGFPNKRVLNRLYRQNVFVYRNDLEGNIAFVCDLEYCRLKK